MYPFPVVCFTCFSILYLLFRVRIFSSAEIPRESFARCTCTFGIRGLIRTASTDKSKIRVNSVNKKKKNKFGVKKLFRILPLLFFFYHRCIRFRSGSNESADFDTLPGTRVARTHASLIKNPAYAPDITNDYCACVAGLVGSLSDRSGDHFFYEPRFESRVKVEI